MNSQLQYDPYQFAGGGMFPASARSGLAISDYRASMHTERHALRNKFVPPFALNDAQLQHVLMLRAWQSVHGRCPLPEGINREKLDRAATRHALRGYRIDKRAAAIQHQQQRAHKRAVKRAGSYMALQASIAYRAWRLGGNSVSVAEELGLTPWAIRQILWRIRALARQLGFDVGPDGHTAGMRRKKRKATAHHRNKC